MENTKFVFALVFTFGMLIYSCGKKQEKNFTATDINIIPKPAELVLNKSSFRIDKNTTIIAHDSLKNVAKILVTKLKSSGVDVVFSQSPRSNSIVFATKQELENEAYEVSIKNEKIVISANSQGGFLYGVQSLFQLLPTEIYGNNTNLSSINN